MVKNQRGFTALEAILIIVIVAVVGFAGWYVYKANDKKKDDNKTTTSQQQTNNTDGGNQEPAKNNTKTISLKEWGVQAEYMSDQTLVYKINEGIGSAYFSSTELKAQGGAGCSEENGGGGLIQRLKPTDGTDADGQGPTAEEAAKTSSDFKKVGNYYYRFIHSQAACGDTTEKTAQAQQVVNDLVKSLVPTLKPVQ